MYRIFISHSWKYSNQYDKIVEFLDDGGVTYYNHSVPKDDPVHTNGTDKLLVFELDEPVVTKTVEQVIVPESAEDSDENNEEIVVEETVKVYPPSWGATFGTPILSISHGSLLTQQHYSGDWDVLRPAKVIEEMNALSSDMLAELMEEAEAIMEGWENYDGADESAE